MSNTRQADATIRVRSFGVNFRGGHISPPRNPDWHQLLYASEGVMTVRTPAFAWVVPPHRAIWIPRDVAYSVDMAGPVAIRAIYIRAKPRSVAALSQSAVCQVVNVRPLLRELILRTIELGALDAAIPAQKHLAAVVIDELNQLHEIPLQLPFPSDPRAVRLASLALDPVEAAESLAQLVTRSGASRRTLERIFQAETSMSLGQWLRRARLQQAIQRLSSGEQTKSVAARFGYTPSAFIATFRRELGRTPGQYLNSSLEA